MTRLSARQLIAAASLALLGGNALAACYTVYDRQGRVQLQSAQPPVDLSQPLHQALAPLAPGGHMVFDADAACAELGRRDTSAIARVAATGATPLLTDRRTAVAMGLPHEPLRGNVVVARQPEGMPSGFTVVPPEPTLAATPLREPVAPAAPDLSVMGAAPAPVADAPRPAARGRAPALITELHNPPLRAVHLGGAVVITEIR